MAATDLLTLDDAKTALRIAPESTDRDDRVAAYVGAVSNRIDAGCGPVVARPVTEYLSGRDSNNPMSLGNWIRTRLTPVLSFTSIVEYSSGVVTGPALTAETTTIAGTYRAERFMSSDPPGLFSGKLWRRNGFSNASWAAGDDNVVVTFQAGRYATQAEVLPTRFGRAAVFLLKHWWAAEDLNVHTAGGFDTPFPSFPMTMPNAIREILANDWYAAVGIS